MNVKHYQVKEKTIRGITGFQIQWFQESYFTKNGFPADWVEVKNGWFKDRDEAIDKARDIQIENGEEWW